MGRIGNYIRKIDNTRIRGQHKRDMFLQRIETMTNNEKQVSIRRTHF